VNRLIGKVSLTRSWPFAQPLVEQWHRQSGPRLLMKSGFRRPPRNGVYIMSYHSISDPDQRASWETAYGRVSTDRSKFQKQIGTLLEAGYVPATLSSVPDLFPDGQADRPYLVVTFDDAYATLGAVAPFLKSVDIRPALFVNGAFCEKTTYYRVLAALLCHNGYADQLRSALSKALPFIAWSDSTDRFFAQTKDLYVPGTMEAVVEETFRERVGNPNDVGCHLGIPEIRSLQSEFGWEVGNHTWYHETLSALEPDAQGESLERNRSYLQKKGISMIPWIAYPNGLSSHVNLGVSAWMETNPDHHGIFAGGGVNYHASHTEWLRIPVGNEDQSHFEENLHRSRLAASIAFRTMRKWTL
jgi:peptidoglycan/xylan/chitin deacetylase (PgdA/CDA1 family)